MAFHCIKVIFKILCIFVMVGLCHTFQQSVFVIPHLLLSVLLLVLMVVIHPSTTMRSGIPLPNWYLKIVLMWLLNQLFRNYKQTLSPSLKSGAHHYVRAQGFWGLHHQQAYLCILTSMCLTPWLHLIVTPPSLLALDPMIVRNIEHINNRFVKWKEKIFYPLVFS